MESTIVDTAPTRPPASSRGLLLLLLAACVSIIAVLAMPAHAGAAAAPRTGLAATYYDTASFKVKKLQRVDQRINFTWGAKSPSARIARDTFSARWTGFVVAPRAGRYTFTTRASDGVRVWIDGKLRINRWSRTAPARASTAALRLARGRHAIRIDYYEHTGHAQMQLLWSGPGFRTPVVPPARLVPPTPPRKPANIGAGQAWSDPATWGGTVPADGASVTIPAGKHVVLDRDVSLANLTVNGALSFARRDLTLVSDWVLVHGTLQVGTEAAPFAQRAVIRLRDQAPGEDVMKMGDKVLAVMGGTLDLHGTARTGWTRLAATAPRGADRIVVGNAAGWKVGDRIAIASTDFNLDQAEEATVTAVAGNTLTLDEPLEYAHYGELQTIAGRQLDERAEVALLSRNVTFEGEATSSANGFGAQIMVMDGGTARVSNAELQRVGQAGLLRRYPIHFHMLGAEGAGSFVRGTAIHHSNNRCTTIHGTNGVSYANNVCYDHRGHGVFLEDGAERDNVIAGNLAFGTRAPEDGKRLLASDDSPASYWITNPDNVVRNNVAAGSEGHGFWIALPEHPTGLFQMLYPGQARAMWNRRMALTEFAGNRAHSNGQDGLHFDRGPRPDGTVETTHHVAHADPADPESGELVTTMRGFTSFKNRGHGAWLRGSHHRMVDTTFADNAIGATFASDESFLQDSFVVGESANAGTPASWEAKSGGVGRDGRSAPRPWDADFPIRGFEFYDGRVGVERTLFANFQPWSTASGARREQSALGYHVDNDFSIHPKNFASAVQFANARQVYAEAPEEGHDGDVSAMFVDADGSVTGTAGRVVMTKNPFLYGTGCGERAEWNVMVCSGDYASLLVDGGTTASVRPVTIKRPDGQVQTLRASTGDGATDASTSILTNSTYRVAVNGGTPNRARFVLWRGKDRWTKVSVQRAPGFTVKRYGCNVGEARSWCFGAAASMAALDSANRTGYFYDAASQTLTLKLASVDADWDELVVE